MATAQSARYGACMDQVLAEPLAAYEEALAWKSDGGGAPALHCIASSLLAMGELARAADRLEDLGHAPDLTSKALRVHIFGQAGEVFLQLHQPKRALSSINAGLVLAPNNIELHIARARAQNALGQSAEAWADLDQVLTAQPDHLLALQLRATLAVQQGKLKLARIDVERAMHLAPKNVDVLLVRGAYREAKRLAANP